MKQKEGKSIRQLDQTPWNPIFSRPPSQKSQVKKFMVLFCQVSQLVSSLIDNFIGRVVRTQGFFSQKERNFPFSRIDFFMATWSKVWGRRGERWRRRKKREIFAAHLFLFFFSKFFLWSSRLRVPHTRQGRKLRKGGKKCFHEKQYPFY